MKEIVKLFVDLNSSVLTCPACRSDPSSLTILREGIVTDDPVPNARMHPRRHGGEISKVAVVCLNWHHFVILIKYVDQVEKPTSPKS